MLPRSSSRRSTRNPGRPVVRAIELESPHEIIDADGGRTDRTVTLPPQAGVRVTDAPQGRASQMNLAAAMDTGEFLLFLRADTLRRPPIHK